MIATLNINKTTIYLLSIKDEEKNTEIIKGFNATTHKYYDIDSLEDILKLINKENQREESKKYDSKELQKKKQI